MNYPTDHAPDADAALIDLAGRFMLTHAIAPEHAMRALRIDRDEALALVAEGRLTRPLDADRRERLLLFVNVLQRLEWRLRHESAAVRHALEAPLDALGGASIGQTLDGSLDELRALRRAVDLVEAPKVRWWRVGH